jgi:hypothetical protein
MRWNSRRQLLGVVVGTVLQKKAKSLGRYAVSGSTKYAADPS